VFILSYFSDIVRIFSTMCEKFLAISDKVSENFLHRCYIAFVLFKIFPQCFSAINLKLTVVTISFDIYLDTFLYVHIYCKAREQNSFLCFTIYGK